MKRTYKPAVATANSRTGRSPKIALALAASVSLLTGGSSVFAFGGRGGEQIISSRVVSDVVVGGSAQSSANIAGDVASGACASAKDGINNAGTLQGGSGAVLSGDGSAVYADGLYGGAVQGREYGQPDLFYNFYTQGAANAANAQMYVAPVPVPPHVGHTFLTYQPFYPHEMLYKHNDRFHNYYDGGRGMNRTNVKYTYPPVKTAVSNFYWNVLRLPR